MRVRKERGMRGRKRKNLQDEFTTGVWGEVETAGFCRRSTNGSRHFEIPNDEEHVVWNKHTGLNDRDTSRSQCPARGWECVWN